MSRVRFRFQDQPIDRRPQQREQLIFGLDIERLGHSKQ